MTLEELKSHYLDDSVTHLVAGKLNTPGYRAHLQGLRGSGDAFFAHAILRHTEGTHLFICSDKEEAAYFLNDLTNLSDKSLNILFFPAAYRRPYQIEETDNSNVVLRAEVLNEINRRTKRTIIVSYGEALHEKVVTRKLLSKNTLEVKVGEDYSIDFITELLFELKFERVDYVYEPGQFAVRGGIVDIFSFSSPHPYRIEFFGEEADSIRTFDPVSQLSVKQLTKCSIVPNVQKSLLREGRQTFLDYLPDQTVVWLKDYQLTIEQIDLEYERAEKVYEKIESPLNHLPPADMYNTGANFASNLEKLSVIEFGQRIHFKNGEAVNFKMEAQPVFNKNFELLTENLKNLKKEHYQTIIAAASPNQVERLYNIFEDKSFDVDFTPIVLNIHGGFIDHDRKLAIYTDHQVFERYHRFRLKEGFKKTKEAITIKELHNLQKGDFVVHIDHGVGRFSGLETQEVNGKKQEVIRLLYKNNDILYVSIHSLHRISRYTGKDGTQPTLNKIGGTAWKKLKAKTKSKVKELAYNLIQLYAARKKKRGFAFSPDTYLQHELEASFIYEDTPDQEKATTAVKKDMEEETPMDRLVCGDVGFGKTEIAIRAAFKAVADSKQVAVLVPTTVLSLQHYKTFKDRLQDMPCRVDYINRFKSTAKVKQTLQDLADGKVDILIGTHRIVGKDVKWKNLGLMIIDEEQKFGVAVKDKLKTVKVNVDSLTLTATPIPRTLQFSMMGARDLSIINTPPPNRYPVQTTLNAFNEETIRDAIMYEVSRGGQVFFIHNRVQNIHDMAGTIKRICPDVRIAIGHGQMDGKKLEEVMVDFMDGLYDVLLATTIIESGIDVPNANTIIINQAQNFGLSDLHQLRGRVGRSNKKAFCYLITPPMSTLTQEARKRLNAIVQFSELGSGFNIAMRDLDIRGAGNLLGGEQSGFISDIGFETYKTILEEAMQELKENEFKDLFKEEETNFVKDLQLETDLELRIPEDYVNQIAERLSLYREMNDITNEEELKAFGEQLTDRFGPLPEQVEHLMDSVRLRWHAENVGFERIILKNGKMIGYFVSNEQSPYYQSESFTKVLDFIKKRPDYGMMSEKNGRLRFAFPKVKTVQQAIQILKALQGKETIAA